MPFVSWLLPGTSRCVRPVGVSLVALAGLLNDAVGLDDDELPVAC
jgi:hypothetical protein